MNLSEQAEIDLAMTLEDTESGFGDTATIFNPGQTEQSTINGSFNSIHKSLDPAGLMIVTQNPTFVVRQTTVDTLVVSAVFSDYPGKHWLIDIVHLGKTVKGEISQVRQDKRLGTITYVIIGDKSR